MGEGLDKFGELSEKDKGMTGSETNHVLGGEHMARLEDLDQSELGAAENSLNRAAELNSAWLDLNQKMNGIIGIEESRDLLDRVEQLLAEFGGETSLEIKKQRVEESKKRAAEVAEGRIKSPEEELTDVTEMYKESSKRILVETRELIKYGVNHTILLNALNNAIDSVPEDFKLSRQDLEKTIIAAAYHINNK